MKDKFIMECHDKFNIPNRGWVVVGKVINGIAKISSEVLLLDNGNNILQKGFITAIEINRELHDECKQGQVVGLFLRDVNLDNIQIENKYVVSTSVSNVQILTDVDVQKQIYALRNSVKHMDEILNRTELNSEIEIIHDIRNFLLFLAFANKDISDDELVFVNTKLFLDYDKQSITEKYYHSDVSNYMFYKIPPHSFFGVVCMEEITLRAGYCNEFMDIAERYIKVFETIGKEFITCEQKMDEKKVINYIKYLYEMKRYLAEKTGKYMIDIELQLSKMDVTIANS